MSLALDVLRNDVASHAGVDSPWDRRHIGARSSSSPPGAAMSYPPKGL
jgi:hypothetical protein